MEFLSPSIGLIHTMKTIHYVVSVGLQEHVSLLGPILFIVLLFSCIWLLDIFCSLCKFLLIFVYGFIHPNHSQKF